MQFRLFTFHSVESLIKCLSYFHIVTNTCKGLRCSIVEKCPLLLLSCTFRGLDSASDDFMSESRELRSLLGLCSVTFSSEKYLVMSSRTRDHTASCCLWVPWQFSLHPIVSKASAPMTHLSYFTVINTITIPNVKGFSYSLNWQLWNSWILTKLNMCWHHTVGTMAVHRGFLGVSCGVI